MLKFKKASGIEFDKRRNAVRQAILDGMEVDDAFKIPKAKNKKSNLKSWRNCVYRHSAKTDRFFSIMKSKGNYYIVRVS